MNMQHGVIRQSIVALIVGTAGMLAHAAEPIAFSPDGTWTVLDASPATALEAPTWIRPQKYAAVQLNTEAMRIALSKAPMEWTPAAAAQPLEIALPLPDGTFGRFSVVESPTMAPALQAQYPDIRTYRGQGIDDPHASVRFDLTPAGFHAQVLTVSTPGFDEGGAWYIDPISRDDTTNYASYYKRDYARPAGKSFRCDVDLMPQVRRVAGPRTPAGGGPDFGENLRTYKIAIAATGEYTTFHGGTVAKGLAAINTSLNRVRGVFEREAAVSFTLVETNNNIVYTNAGTDPYTPPNTGAMLGQNVNALNTAIGFANFDIGHVYYAGNGGGVAYLASVCGNLKAGGVTGVDQPVGDPFDVDYVAHEIGHQFACYHSFNSCGGGMGGPETSALEPGSASSIMGYAGLCGPDDLQTNSDPHFNINNIEQIREFVTNGIGFCGTVTNTGNKAPFVNAGLDVFIPASTPFAPTAVGSDPDGDAVAYLWESADFIASSVKYDAVLGNFPDKVTNPIIRSDDAVASPTRVIPRWQELLSNQQRKGETLPTTNRQLKMRVTARDNRSGGGGVTSDNMNITVVTSAGPFTVTSPNSVGVAWAVGSTQKVTWNVANTNLAPVSAGKVRIDLSLDGGLTWPIVLAPSVNNTGQANVSVPGNLTPTNKARVRVSAIGNIFFDISNTNFTISVASCGSDCDGDGQLTINDFICFQTLFVIGDPKGDCDANGVFNIDDFVCFQTLFVLGC